jgi:hypothetical protein
VQTHSLNLKVRWGLTLAYRKPKKSKKKTGKGLRACIQKLLFQNMKMASWKTGIVYNV